MKNFIRNKFCTNIDDLKEAIKEFSLKVTPEYCQKYIKKIKRGKIEIYILSFFKLYDIQK